MFKNTQQITEITMMFTSHNYCAIGKDWYTIHFTLTMEPDELIPDYCEIGNFADNVLDGKELVTEDAIKMLAEFVIGQYKPKHYKITADVSDSTHPHAITTRAE